MRQPISQEKRQQLFFKLAEFLDLSSDEYMLELLEEVSADYAKGYVDAFVANAGENDIRMVYQFVRTINMS